MQHRRMQFYSGNNFISQHAASSITTTVVILRDWGTQQDGSNIIPFAEKKPPAIERRIMNDPITSDYTVKTNVD